jgi:ADP-ribosylglycohydrolase
LEVAIQTLGNGSYVFEALPLSIYIFLSNTHMPLEALWQAINSYGEFGGDTDSIGFITGALAGSYAGISIFPKHLVEDLEKSEYYIELADRLYEITEEMIIRR